jgi:hypothetical protein
MVKLKVGDKVRVIRSNDESCADAWIEYDKKQGARVGDVGIVKSNFGIEVREVDFNEHRLLTMNVSQLELVPDFKVGDRVVHAKYGGGVIRYYHTLDWLVEFDRYIHGHSGSSYATEEFQARDGHGRWFKADELTPEKKHTREDKPVPQNTTKTTFKVGDRVDHFTRKECRNGKIIKAHADDYYSVVWPNFLRQGCYPVHLLVAATTPTSDHIVILRENGTLKPASRPFIHGDETAAAKESQRLAALHPSGTFEIWARVGGHRGAVKERPAVEKYVEIEVVV